MHRKGNKGMEKRGRELGGRWCTRDEESREVLLLGKTDDRESEACATRRRTAMYGQSASRGAGGRGGTGEAKRWLKSGGCSGGEENTHGVVCSRRGALGDDPEQVLLQIRMLLRRGEQWGGCCEGADQAATEKEEEHGRFAAK